MAGGADSFASFSACRAPSVARTCQHRVELLANQFLDERANPPADARLDRIDPVIEKLRTTPVH
jgi:hypothetical protein